MLFIALVIWFILFSFFFLFTCLSVCLSVCLFVCLFLFVFFESVGFFLSINLSFVLRPPGQRFALLEEKLVLAHVLRNFTLDSTQTFDELRPCAELISRPKDGIIVSLAKRH